MDTEAQAAVNDEAAPSELEAELASLRKLSDERYQELQYARAEIENVRKRLERTAADRIASGRKQTLSKFLPVLDNLQRALAFDDSSALRGGLQATLRSFEGVLAAEGVTAVDTVGQPFDPRTAEAISTRETSDYADDIVVEEAQRGYSLGEDLLRPALVIVAKHVDRDPAV